MLVDDVLFSAVSLTIELTVTPSPGKTIGVPGVDDDDTSGDNVVFGEIVSVLLVYTT